MTRYFDYDMRGGRPTAVPGPRTHGIEVIPHASFAPSRAERWRDCPGVLRGAYHDMKFTPGMVIAGSMSYRPEYSKQPLRKSTEQRDCGGVTCAPGLGGKCTQCDDPK